MRVFWRANLSLSIGFLSACGAPDVAIDGGTVANTLAVGGTEAPQLDVGVAGVYPSHVGLALSDGMVGGKSWNCGAARIGKRTFLTAAHCMDPLSPPQRPQVRLRATNGRWIATSAGAAPFGTSFPIAAFRTHTSWISFSRLGTWCSLLDICQDLAVFSLKVSDADLATAIDPVVKIATLAESLPTPGQAVVAGGFGCTDAFLGRCTDEGLAGAMSTLRYGSESVLNSVGDIIFRRTGGTIKPAEGDSGSPIYAGDIVLGIHSTLFGWIDPDYYATAVYAGEDFISRNKPSIDPQAGETFNLDPVDAKVAKHCDEEIANTYCSHGAVREAFRSCMAKIPVAMNQHSCLIFGGESCFVTRFTISPDCANPEAATAPVLISSRSNYHMGDRANLVFGGAKDLGATAFVGIIPASTSTEPITIAANDAGILVPTSRAVHRWHVFDGATTPFGTLDFDLPGAGIWDASFFDASGRQVARRRFFESLPTVSVSPERGPVEFPFRVDLLADPSWPDAFLVLVPRATPDSPATAWEARIKGFTLSNPARAGAALMAPTMAGAYEFRLYRGAITDPAAHIVARATLTVETDE